MIGRSISKIIRDQSTGIMIVTCWPTQDWFPLMIQVLIDHPVKLPSIRNKIESPSNGQKLHILLPKFLLLAVLLSGKPSEQHNFQMRLKKPFMIHGEPRQNHDMREFSKNREINVYNEMKIPILQI